MLGSAESQVLKLIIREIVFEEFQRVWSQSTNVTDRRTDRQTTYHGNSALHYASRGKKTNSKLYTYIYTVVVGFGPLQEMADPFIKTNKKGVEVDWDWRMYTIVFYASLSPFLLENWYSIDHDSFTSE